MNAVQLLIGLASGLVGAGWLLAMVWACLRD